jgi:hypothetical protein
MAKILAVIPKTYEKDGETKTLYNVTLQKADGTKIGATSFEPIKDGEEIDESRIHPGKRDGEWVIWSDKKGGGGKQWVKNDELIIVQVAYKGIIDLMVAGQVKAITPALLLSHSKMIQATAKALKDGKGIEENPLS